MVSKNCERCDKEMSVRQADIDRGWGRFCSKSCKAKQQTSKKGYAYRRDYEIDDLEDCGHPMASGYFGHGQS